MARCAFFYTNHIGLQDKPKGILLRVLYRFQDICGSFKLKIYKDIDIYIYILAYLIANINAVQIEYSTKFNRASGNKSIERSSRYRRSNLCVIINHTHPAGHRDLMARHLADGESLIGAASMCIL
uniref:Uncharacterized protein n=1 Tax=Glossina palpalis gambiensis TaxID=67801 RepID=A0A1B0BZT1_9MUSC